MIRCYRIFQMLEPYYIGVSIEAPDIIRTVLQSRHSQLEQKHPQFRTSFDKFDQKYTSHF